MTDFVSPKVLASLLGISDRAIELAIARAYKRGDMKWRGAHLVVREIHGRGGRSGISYQVRVDSPPPISKNVRRRFEARSNGA